MAVPAVCSSRISAQDVMGMLPGNKQAVRVIGSNYHRSYSAKIGARKPPHVMAHSSNPLALRLSYCPGCRYCGSADD